MKIYNAIKRMSPQARRAIENAIAQHEQHKGSYLKTPYGSASSRRRAEQEFKVSHPSFIVKTAHGEIEVETFYEQSCRNVYYSMRVYFNGQKKNIITLKALIK